MYSTNIILKTIITILFIIVTILLQNYYLFWLLLFYLLLLTIVDKNIKSLVIIFFIALILLFIWFTAKIRMLSQGLIILDLLVLYITSITKRDIWKIKYEEGYKSINKRKKVFMDNFKPYLKNNEKVRFEKVNYDAGEDILDRKVKSDANDLYAYSKVRFYGYGKTVTSLYGRWTIYDLIFCVVSLGILALIVVCWNFWR